MSLLVRTTPEADAQIRDIDSGGRTIGQQRRFLDELAASFGLIGDAPHIGRPYPPSDVPGTRRVLLAGSRYHVYYVPRADDVTVLAVWHARRGGGPPLRTL